MATRFRSPVFRVANDDFSAAGAGWELYFYQTGTSTPKDTFSDDELTTANTNPVVSDADGWFGDIFLESGDYRVVLKDADGVTKRTWDPVSGDFASGGEVEIITSDRSVVQTDDTNLLAVDASSGNVTITLLAAVTAGNGFQLAIKKTDSSSNTVTIDGDGSETIDGAATLVLSDQYQSVTLRSDGSNWQVISLGRDLPLGTAAVEDLSGLPATVLANTVALSGDISPSQITADQDDYSPTGLSGASTLRLSTDASRTITGLTGGSDGRVLLLHNVGSNDLVLTDESGSSTAANRFALGEDITLGADWSILLRYDATSSRWRVMAGLLRVGAWETIQRQEIASAVSSVVFTELDASVYDAYRITITNLDTSTNALVRVDASPDSGTSWTSLITPNTSANVDVATANRLSAVVEIFGVHDAATYATIMSRAVWVNTSGAAVFNSEGEIGDATETYDQFRVRLDSGDLEGGVIVFEGLRK